MNRKWLRRTRRISLLFLAGTVFFLTGCQTLGNDGRSVEQTQKARAGEKRNNADKKTDGLSALENKEILCEAENAAGLYQDIYSEAVKSLTLDSLETKEKILKLLGKAGYSAVDWNNQLDMQNPGNMKAFCVQAAEGKEVDAVLLRLLDDGGLIWHSLKSGKKEIRFERYAVSWDKSSIPAVSYLDTFTACTWSYTPKGYFLFEKYQPPGYDGPSGHYAVRVEPLDQYCRELNRSYILPVGYEDNNLFLTEWSESDYSGLSLDDMYEKLYLLKYNRQPDLVGGEICVEKQAFEGLLQSRFQIDEETLQSLADFDGAKGIYRWRARGMGDFPSCILPSPEVTSYRENGDGTLTLTVDAVWEDENTDCAFTHEVTIRTKGRDDFQYVSNHILHAAVQKIPPYIKRTEKQESKTIVTSTDGDAQ